MREIGVLEEQARAEYAAKGASLRSALEERRILFAEQVGALQRTRAPLLQYLRLTPVLGWIVAPVIYAGIVPLVLLDVFLSVYQALNFGVYGIAHVKRSDYLVLDRVDLVYLNPIERLNCLYCGYANGLIAYGREIAARTEQFFCPIKHARRILAAHDHYSGFFEYGDAESYRQGLQRLRDALGDLPSD
jgi:hypothetical protein